MFIGAQILEIIYKKSTEKRSLHNDINKSNNYVFIDPMIIVMYYN